MTHYNLIIKPSAQKELDALSDPLFNRIESRILALETNPRPPGCIKLKNEDIFWRIRIGDYRVVYAIDNTKKTIWITRIAHRSQVYD